MQRGEKCTEELKIRIILVLNNPQVSQFRNFLGKWIIPVSFPSYNHYTLRLHSSLMNGYTAWLVVSVLLCLLSKEILPNLSSLQDPFRYQNQEIVSSGGHNLVFVGSVAPSLLLQWQAELQDRVKKARLLWFFWLAFFNRSSPTSLPQPKTNPHFIPHKKALFNGVLGLEMDEGNCVPMY